MLAAGERAKPRPKGELSTLACMKSIENVLPTKLDVLQVYPPGDNRQKSPRDADPTFFEKRFLEEVTGTI
uniref:Uncharacterized protein n=1 Tax=Anopheles atroparvus TaxID=41427 RepID=A0AAG5DQ53_ANOAO